MFSVVLCNTDNKVTFYVRNAQLSQGVIEAKPVLRGQLSETSREEKLSKTSLENKQAKIISCDTSKKSDLLSGVETPVRQILASLTANQNWPRTFEEINGKLQRGEYERVVRI